MSYTRILGGLFCMTVFLSWVGPVMAHRVIIFAWVEGDTVFTESKFSGGKTVKGGKVVVSDLKGRKLLEGKTNDRGEFSFKIPERTGMKIVLKAGMGHRGEWTIPADELGGDPDSGPAPSEKKETGTMEKKEPVASGAGIEQIRKVVEQCLDKRLRPVMKLLVESRDRGPTFREIVGGIGYIFGLAGVAAYFNYRRRTKGRQGVNRA